VPVFMSSSPCINRPWPHSTGPVSARSASSPGPPLTALPRRHRPCLRGYKQTTCGKQLLPGRKPQGASPVLAHARCHCHACSQLSTPSTSTTATASAAVQHTAGRDAKGVGFLATRWVVYLARPWGVHVQLAHTTPQPAGMGLEVGPLRNGLGSATHLPGRCDKQHASLHPC
jgi:hypothetical protein